MNDIPDEKQSSDSLQPQSPVGLERAPDHPVAGLSDSGQNSLQQAFTEWLTQHVLPARFPGQSFDHLKDLTEIQAMLHQRVPEWTRAWEEAARQRELRPGRQEGPEEAVCQVARKMLADGVNLGWIKNHTGQSDEELDNLLD